MEAVSKYYAQKARIEANDEYLERINETDIDIMRKAGAWVLIAPFVSVGVLYTLQMAKKDWSMAENWVYSMRSVTERLVHREGSYARSKTQPTTPEPTRFADSESHQESENLRNLYEAIKEEKKAGREQKVSEMRELNRKIVSPGGQ